MTQKVKTSSLSSLLAVALVTIATVTIVTTATAQQQSKAQVMILGVYHFANPNADVVKSNFPDHLSEKKQEEIAELLDLLAKFKPTKIVVERTPDDVAVQQNYQAYLKNEYKLPANETEQIGYRLAKRMGHTEVYLADNRIAFDFDAIFKAAQETNNKYFLETTAKVLNEVQEMQKRLEQKTVRDALLEMNEPQLQDRTKDFYLQMTRVRSKDKFVGADALASWYQRNFRILTNLTQIIDSPQDRVLVIFGQGHIPYLRDGIRSSPDMQLIEPNDYLRKQ